MLADATLTALRRSGRRRWLLLVPLIPCVALLTAAWLPIVNHPGLWFGMPRIIVWCSVWSLAITPALAVVEYGLVRPAEGDE